MVINGKVYDVTRYIPFHPGGNKILMGVGKDGTELYSKDYFMKENKLIFF